jgi:hypothetical protein
LTGIGQGAVLQAWVSVSGGQGMPPLVGCRVTVRVRVCIPPPQVRLQVPHSPQSLTRQSVPGTQLPSRHTPPGQFDSLAAWLQDLLFVLQLRQGPAQFAALQVPTQAPPWHSARLPAQVSGVQIGVQAPALHCPFGHPVPGGASTHWSITQARQGAGQLLLVQLLPRQMPVSAQFGAVAGQDSGRSTQAPEASQTRRMRVPGPPQRALPHEEFRGSRRQPPAPSQPLVQAPSLHRPAGSAPRAGTLAHVPSCPGSAQDLHDPVQAVAQHRP